MIITALINIELLVDLKTVKNGPILYNHVSTLRSYLTTLNLAALTDLMTNARLLCYTPSIWKQARQNCD